MTLTDRPDAGPSRGNVRNRFERDKAGLALDVVRKRLHEVAAEGSAEGFDRPLIEQLRVLGVALRQDSPERFMVRVRIPGGHLSTEQVRTLGKIARQHGQDRVDITTRAQLQLRSIPVREIAAVVETLGASGLVSQQTLMDSVRNIRGCPMAGLVKDAPLDATPVLHELEAIILEDERLIDLPKKVNIAVTGCGHQCCHANVQDIALVPACQAGALGFNVLIGGKVSGMDPRLAVPLDVFLSPATAARAVREIVRIFQMHGSRTTRSKARLVHLVDKWGLAPLRDELQRRSACSLAREGEDLRDDERCDPVGIVPQDATTCAVGLSVPVGRISGTQLIAVAELAERYGSGDVRLTGDQNILVPNVAKLDVNALRRLPLLRELPMDPHPVIAGTQSCTGSEFCSMAAIPTKQRALELAEQLAQRLPSNRRLRIHWSACHAGCGQHAIADIGLVGRRVRIGAELVDAVDVYVGGSERALAKKVREQVPIDNLLDELMHLICSDPRLAAVA